MNKRICAALSALLCVVSLTLPIFAVAETQPLTPDGNLEVVDDILHEDKQFITVQSRSGAEFYIVIDRSRDSDNVYFLNQVDDVDLFALLEEECCRASFLRGAFLSGGSVTDPQKRYHLELATSHVQAGREVEALLRDMGFEPKNVMRQNNLITYFKSSTHIEDLLTLIGAPGRALEIMSAKIEKEMRNTVNRRVNCDAANLDKAVLASREQVEAFTRLTESGAINDLPVKLQEVAIARLLQPELTLSELAATFDPPLTKSCLNHRIRKLMEIAKKEENE